MKNDDATAMEIEKLLRDALSSGAESAHGGTPLLQLKTVPLPVQPAPVAPARPTVAATEPIAPGLADKLAPESVRPPAPSPSRNRSRASVFTLLGMGTFTLAALAGAIWLAREHHTDAMFASAELTTTSPSDDTAVQDAVGIAVAARPAAEGPKETAPAPPPPFKESASAPPKAGTKPETRGARPRHSAVTEKTEAKAKAEKADADRVEAKVERAAPVVAGHTPSAVDAVLQQQLKSAIP